MNLTDHPAQIATLLEGQGHGGIYRGQRLSDDYLVVASQEIDTGRWSRYDLMVIEGPYGSLWGVEQESGLTEYQEVDKPFGPGPIEVVPVRAVPAIRYAKNTDSKENNA